MQDKASLRKMLRELSRSRLTTALRERGSTSIIAQLLARPYWREARRVRLYMALADEPDLSALIQQAQGKELFLPRVLDGETMAFFRYTPGQDLERSRSFGLLEPSLASEEVQPSDLDLLIIPALGYDAEGYRLGRGKGYYDRYLTQTSGKRLGVTFGLQRFDQLPHDAWDLPMDEVLYPIPALL